MTNPQAGQPHQSTGTDARVQRDEQVQPTPVSQPAALPASERAKSRAEAGLERQSAALQEELRKVDLRDAAAKARQDLAEMHACQTKRQALLDRLASTEDFLKRIRERKPG